jgi:hypothetical protein
MITISYNEVQRSVDFHLDLKGIDLLIETLEALKSDGDHLHLYCTNDDKGLSMTSPYKAKTIYTELILNLLPSEAWSDQY